MTTGFANPSPPSKESPLNTSELFVQCLKNEGVEQIFGIPGEENAAFVMAAHAGEIPFVLTRHEQGAAFMAEVYGRLTGKAGVCLATLGPGATNLATGVADGNMDRSPMIVLTGQADSRRQHKESHQNMDVVSLFRPVTKWATPISQPENVPEVIRKAFKLAQSEKPGACHVELAEDIAKATVVGKPLRVVNTRRPVPDATAVKRAVEVIQSAKRPIILAGNGTIRRRASLELRRFAELTGIGVASTFMAKGCVDMDAPYCLFTIGLQAKDVVACAVDAADVVITVGYDMVEYHPRLWNESSNKRIVHLDFLPAEVDQHYHAEVELVGDVAAGLAVITDELEKAKFEKLVLSQHESVRKQMVEELEAHKDDEAEGALKPQKVLYDLRQVMGPEDIVLSDVGAHKMWIARHYHCNEPNTCLIPNGFCSMGFALPGAIAAKRVHPDRRVVAVCGDGGFLMNVQEMETAVRIKANIVVMVWEDGGYGLISWKQKNEYGTSTPLEFGNPDFLQLASAFGWNGVRVERSRDLKGSLEEAFASDKPTLLTLPIDYRENLKLTERLGEMTCPI